MVDVNVDSATGQWGTLTLGVPDWLEDTREAINTVAELLITVLDIMLSILNIAKGFLVGYIDPIQAIVKALLAEINALLRDLRQLGLYITGDWPLLQCPYKELRGGYQEYERRMIARLTDTTDPTRPDVSSLTPVLSFFFYLSVDISDIQKLVAFVLKMLKFFQQEYNVPGGLPTPIITDVVYGSDAASIFQAEDLGAFFKKGDGTPPNVARVKWEATPPARENTFNPFPMSPPKGFVVTVSSFKDGIPLVYDRPQANAGKIDGQQPRESGPVLDKGVPLVLYGGADTFNLPGDLEYNSAVDSDGQIIDGKTRIYGITQAGQPIPLEDLKDAGAGEDGADIYYFQRVFYVEAPLGQIWGESLSVFLLTEEMPRYASLTPENGKMVLKDDGPAHTLFVRVASTTQELAAAEAYQYDFSKYLPLKGDTTEAVEVTTTQADFDSSSLSPFSGPTVVTFPNVNTKKYLEAVQIALVVLLLSRPDLSPIDTLKDLFSESRFKAIQDNEFIVPDLALERCGLEDFRHLTEFIYKDYAEKMRTRGEDPEKMRSHILKWVQVTVHDLYTKTGPMPDTEAYVVRATENLRKVKWVDILPEEGLLNVDEDTAAATILESLDTDEGKPGAQPFSGLALNPYCIGPVEASVGMMFSVDGLIASRLPQMQEGVVGGDDPQFKATMEVSSEGAETFLLDLPPSLRVVYEKCVRKDGSILVPEEDRAALTALAARQKTVGSADMSPVFFWGADILEDVHPGAVTVEINKAGIRYCRGLFADYEGGILFTESAVALSVAASALRRSPKDGDWIALRFLDTVPGVEDFLAQLYEWLNAISKTVESVVDTIRQFIEYLEARIVELQQLIQRINSLLQKILGYSFQIPKCSALMLLSDGTGGVLSDLVTAENKPPDSALAYGAGIAVVFPMAGVPPVVMDVIKTFLAVSPGDDTDGYLSEEGELQDAIGIEGIPEGTPVPPDPEPDVL